MLNLTDEIAEIIRYYESINYIAPKTILKELSFQRDKIVYLHKNFEFKESVIRAEELKKLRKNQY